MLLDQDLLFLSQSLWTGAVKLLSQSDDWLASLLPVLHSCLGSCKIIYTQFVMDQFGNPVHCGDTQNTGTAFGETNVCVAMLGIVGRGAFSIGLSTLLLLMT